jgi:hypothetical protein
MIDWTVLGRPVLFPPPSRIGKQPVRVQSEVTNFQFTGVALRPSAVAKAKLVNTPELKEMRNATVLYVFAL